MSALNTRPIAGEFPPYAVLYVDAAAAAMAAAQTTSVLTLLEGQAQAMHALLADTDPSLASHAYAPGKWTLAESLLHVADCERVFGYRVLRIARGDQTPLQGFDQDAWVPESGAANRTIADILTEIEAVRGSTLALVRSLTDASVQKTGISRDMPVSARGIVWMIAGHFAHHLDITRTRYLGGA